MTFTTCSLTVSMLLWWQSRHTHLGIPTGQFHLNALQHIHFGPLQLGQFNCSCYSTPFNIKHKNKQVISLSHPAEKSPYSSLTCDMLNAFLTLKICLTFYYYSSCGPGPEKLFEWKGSHLFFIYINTSRLEVVPLTSTRLIQELSRVLKLFIYDKQHL